MHASLIRDDRFLSFLYASILGLPLMYAALCVTVDYVRNEEVCVC